MTQDKARKAAARQRMTQTGEPYSVARRAVQAGTAAPDSDWDTLTPEDLYAREAAEAGVGPEQAAANLAAFRIRELAEQAQRAADDARERADRARERADREEEAAGEAEDRAGLADEEAELAMEAGGPEAEQRGREQADRAREAADRARERADVAEEAAGEAEEQADELEELAAAYADRAGQPGSGGRHDPAGRTDDREQSWRRRQWDQLRGRSRTAPRPPAFLPPEPPGAPGAPEPPHAPGAAHPPAPPRPPR